MNPKDIVVSYVIPGYDDVQVQFRDLDAYMAQTLRLAIVPSVGLGASVILFLLLWVLIKKKRTPAYCLNMTSLALLAGRHVLELCYLTSSLSSLSTAFTGVIVPGSTSALHVTIAANVLHLLLVGVIEASLCFQLYVVLSTIRTDWTRWAFSGAVATLGLTVVGFYLYLTIDISRFYVQVFSTGYATARHKSALTNLPFILFLVSINVISFTLVAKLVVALRVRRYLGLRQFDGMHILTLMLTQTMIVPSILVLITYHDPGMAETALFNISLILIVLSLPFTSMWAAAANNTTIPSSSSLSIISKTPSNQSTFVGSSDKYHFDLPTSMSTKRAPEKFSDLDSMEAAMREIEHDNFVAVTTHVRK